MTWIDLNCYHNCTMAFSSLESYREGHDPEGAWVYTWVPFVYDIHGHTPQRLTHATCHGREYGVESLVDAMHKQDIRQREERVRRSEG